MLTSLRPWNEHQQASRACAAKMKTHHENILSLEAATHKGAAAEEVWAARLYLNKQSVRVLWLLEYFRRDKYSACDLLS